MLRSLPFNPDWFSANIFAKQVDGKAHWTLAKRPCSHDVMVDMPDELATLIAGVA